MSRGLFLQLLFLVFLAHLTVGDAARPAHAQRMTEWSSNLGSTDWFDPSNWTNGVPNAPGDVATFPFARAEARLAAPATIGRLNMAGPATTIAGDGSLVFDNPGDLPARVQSSSTTGAIEPPVSITSGERLQLSVADDANLALSGGFASAQGDIVKVGPGRLTLSGASPTWGGDIHVQQGVLQVDGADVLGNDAGRTQVTDGAIEFNGFQGAETERITLHNSWMRLTGELLGDIETSGDSRITLFRRFQDTGEIEGGIIGDGMLRIDSTPWSATGPQTSSGGALDLHGQINHSGVLRLEGGGELNLRGDLTVDGMLQVGGHAGGAEAVGFFGGQAIVLSQVVAGAVVIDGGSLSLRGGGSLVTSHDRLNIRAGGLGRLALDNERPVSGVSHIEKTTVGRGSVALDIFDSPVAVTVHRGILTVGSGNGLLNEPIRVVEPRHASLAVTSSDTAFDIDLNNSLGMGFGGGLMATRGARLTGDLDLGDVGSRIIGSTRSLQRLSIDGAITGGALHVTGGNVRLAGGGVRAIAP